MAYEMMILLKCIFFGGDSCWALKYFFCFGIAFLPLVCGSVCVPLQGCCRCLLCVLLCDASLSFLFLLCVDVLLVCAEGYTQATGVMAMMMTGRVLLVCALCVLWCGAGGIHARNPDNNSLSGYMASGGFGRKKSFLSNGSIKNLSTPLLLSASFISAIQAEAREGVPSAGVTDSPLSGATGLVPAFSGLVASSPRPTVPGHGTPIPGAAFPGNSGTGPTGHGPSNGAAAFSGLGAAAFSGHAAAVPGAGHSVVGGSEPLDSRSVVTSSSQGGNEKTTPVSVSPDEQIASPEEVFGTKRNRESGHLFARRTANGVIQQ
ncbi:mucin-associated surface protein (MASP), putative [Trypanosoma cruzi]|nr:mucin-associated surface protein (MASP), putative [Trypanosoma cruzi]